MKTMYSLAVIAVVLLFASCEKNDNLVSAAKSLSAVDSLHVPLYGCVSKNYGSDAIVYCLDSVWDSRCPQNVQCVWAGQASAKFRISINSVQHTVKLYTSSINSGSGTTITDTTIAGFNFKLYDVVPYPVYNLPSTNTGAILKVSR